MCGGPILLIVVAAWLMQSVECLQVHAYWGTWPNGWLRSTCARASRESPRIGPAELNPRKVWQGVGEGSTRTHMRKKRKFRSAHTLRFPAKHRSAKFTKLPEVCVTFSTMSLLYCSGFFRFNWAPEVIVAACMWMAYVAHIAHCMLWCLHTRLDNLVFLTCAYVSQLDPHYGYGYVPAPYLHPYHKYPPPMPSLYGPPQSRKMCTIQ